MAIYTELTGEQSSTLEYLFNRAKNIKKRMRNDDSIVDESYKQLLESELIGIQKQINYVFGAREEYEFHIKAAAKHLDEAEKLKKEWGF